MKRRHFITALTMTTAAFALTGGRAMADHGDIKEINLDDDVWRTRLTAEEFRVLRDEGTEPSGSSPLNNEKRTGVFVCAACELPLFKSETKYESGTGWPSFYDAIDGHVDTKLDFKMILPRTEYHCARCGGHQGHVFKDGPEPTGLRYCNNGVALNFVPAEESPA
tara:strand:- start:595 stop:1089 length:495 start_codon:yes stop_codon:yes gene_type:complete